jgi:hypothetical protein
MGPVQYYVIRTFQITEGEAVVVTWRKLRTETWDWGLQTCKVSVDSAGMDNWVLNLVRNAVFTGNVDIK